MTFNSKGKEKDTKYRELELEELPMLAIGEKIKKEGPSRRTPAASTAPSTPAKSCTDEVSTVSNVFSKSAFTWKISTSPPPPVSSERQVQLSSNFYL